MRAERASASAVAVGSRYTPSSAHACSSNALRFASSVSFHAAPYTFTISTGSTMPRACHSNVHTVIPWRFGRVRVMMRA